MKIEIDTESGKIFLLETITIKDLWENLEYLGISYKSEFTIEVKPPIIVVPYHNPNPVITLPPYWDRRSTTNPFEVTCVTLDKITN